jgi:flagellar basal-body rod protein FlgG
MLRGIYAAAAGMDVQQARLDVLSNNLANVRTAGFKKEDLLVGPFSELFLQYREEPLERPEANPRVVGRLNLGAQVYEVIPDLRNGPLQETFNPTDLALEGDGFFTVNTEEGTRYTRDGSFTLNQDGCLATSRGDLVLGENGPIAVGEGEFKVSSDGEVRSKGQVIDRLALAAFKERLVKLENNYYVAPADVQKAETVNLKVKQGYLERSNVQVADEMVDMIGIIHIYEANQKVVKALDELLDKAVNQVGSVK